MFRRIAAATLAALALAAVPAQAAQAATSHDARATPQTACIICWA